MGNNVSGFQPGRSSGVVNTTNPDALGGLSIRAGLAPVTLKWAGTKVSGIVLVVHNLGKPVQGIALTPITAAAEKPILSTSGVPSSTEMGVQGELVVAATTEIAFFWIVVG